MILNLGCIVEGHGDVAAVPVLLQRLATELKPELYLNIERPLRMGRDRLVKPGELEKAIEQLARRLPAPRAILVLIDADDDCPAELGPSLLAWATEARPDISVGVVLAKREFEAWFLAAIGSLAGRRGLPDAIEPIANPESIRNAKKPLTRLMPAGRAYSPRLDQPALTARFDMDLARSCSDSFDKCHREIERLFMEAR